MTIKMLTQTSKMQNGFYMTLGYNPTGMFHKYYIVKTANGWELWLRTDNRPINVCTLDAKNLYKHLPERYDLIGTFSKLKDAKDWTKSPVSL